MLQKMRNGNLPYIIMHIYIYQDGSGPGLLDWVSKHMQGQQSQAQAGSDIFWAGPGWVRSQDGIGPDLLGWVIAHSIATHLESAGVCHLRYFAEPSPIELFS